VAAVGVGALCIPPRGARASSTPRCSVCSVCTKKELSLSFFGSNIYTFKIHYLLLVLLVLLVLRRLPLLLLLLLLPLVAPGCNHCKMRRGDIKLTFLCDDNHTCNILCPCTSPRRQPHIRPQQRERFLHPSVPRFRFSARTLYCVARQISRVHALQHVPSK